ncbi:DUF7638 domain-containing protein [Paenibacillus hexagrammi]|uniref:Uncharacterized protein n=1 Tax=Paenibacillus hexagrammi TaxID=2908839 RepID=A0ABY3SGY6_9BACL|nr:hypothetical protein [Paenibacillus sp. YPD9-1]UJF32670.1 hypothetical protein L0M14_24090 [Paenibacillus sp. YPD9-1]
MQKISRQKEIEGTRVPGIIHNMQYHYVNVDVYEDGMVNCWELVDLAGFNDKMNSHWLVPQVPAGEIFSIHELGAYKIHSAKWKFNKTSYVRHIENMIRILNPNMENIYTISSSEKQLKSNRKVVHAPVAKEFYVKNEMFYQTSEGEGSTIFLKHQDKNYIANLVIYKDGRVTCYTSKFELNFEIEGIEEYFQNGTLFTNFTRPTAVCFEDLGEITFDAVLYSTDINEKYKQLVDTYQKLNGSETSLEKCRKAYYEYLEYPSEFARARLKELYELIPKHERKYLGDMDSRDRDYIRIIYHPERKREV